MKISPQLYNGKTWLDVNRDHCCYMIENECDFLLLSELSKHIYLDLINLLSMDYYVK